MRASEIVRRTGIRPGPNSPLLEVSGRACRDEGAEVALCDELIARVSGKDDGIVNLSQKRESRLTLGLSDRRYRACAIAFFFEVKAEDGKLTPSQHRFLVAELQHGAIASCGTLTDLRALLEVAVSVPVEGRLARLLAHCADTIGRWAAKGYRREAFPRRRRRR